MRHILQFFGSKVVLAILGALLVGGVSATLAAESAPHHPSAPSVSANIGVTATATRTRPTSTPTSTATATPTTAPVINPTATPGSQTTTLRGTITAINQNANTFTLSNNQTVVVDGNTSYGGSAGQFSDLQVGWSARVTAIAQSDGTYLATVVDASGDN